MLGLKAHDTVCLSIKSIVFAQTYIYTGMEVSAALANQNVACENELTISTLGAKTLRLRVTDRSWWSRRPSYEQRAAD